MNNKTSFKKGHKSTAFKDETGKVYGKLTVLSREENTKFGTARWLCRCECGNTIVINAGTLRNGRQKSCGCIKGGVKRGGNIIYSKALSSIRNTSNKKNIPCCLNLGDVIKIMNDACAYCGQPPHDKKYAYHRTRKTEGIESDEYLYLNGIDRINPSGGYTIDNVISCCKYCNRAKSDLSVNEFKEHIIKIYNHLILPL